MRLNLLAAAAAFTSLFAAPAIAAPTLDQSYWSHGTIGAPFYFSPTFSDLPLGQSFTAGLTGTLSEFDMLISYYDSAVVTFEVRAGNGTNGALLGSGTQTLGCGPGDNGWYCGLDVDLSSLDIGVTAGSQYTFLITGMGGDAAGRVALILDDHYGGGHMYAAAYGNPQAWDASFRTFVDQGSGETGVPEPASWALMLGGFGMIGAALRRRRGAHANSV